MAIVEAEDLGYAVQIWTRVIVRGERQPRELARFHDADTLAEDVAAIRARYLEEGWTVDDPIDTLTASLGLARTLSSNAARHRLAI